MNVDLRLDHPAPAPGAPLVLRALLRISGAAPEAKGRIPVNLALVLDRSGSMAGAKLHFAREAAATLIRRLWPEDRISVVAYDNDVCTLFEGATGEDAHRAAVEAVRSLNAGATTNLSGGWLRGRELVDRARVEGGVNRVILMTDGLANMGITDPAALVGLSRTAAREGISTTTIGFGADFNEDLLRAMSDAGSGAAYYVENPDQAPGIFQEEVEGLLGLAAQNVTVELRPGPDARFTALRHSYPLVQLEGGVRMDIGDLYQTEPRLALMEFLVPTAAPGSLLEIGTIEVAGHVLTSEGGVERKEITLPVRLEVGEGPRVDAEIQRTELLLRSARAREEALERQGYGDVEGARDALHLVARELGAMPDGDLEAHREAADLQAMADTLAHEGLFHAPDIKYLKQHAYDQRRSRRGARDRYWRG